MSSCDETNEEGMATLQENLEQAGVEWGGGFVL